MAVGRISGPLLAQNLLRNGVDLAFETQLLYLNVTNGQIGIQTATPQYTLDVNGSARIGNVIVSSSNTGTLITNGTGNIVIQSATESQVQINNDTLIKGNLHATGNITADGSVQIGNMTGSDTLSLYADIISDITPQTPNQYNIGNPQQTWEAGYFNNVIANTFAGVPNAAFNIGMPPGQDINVGPITNPMVNINGSVRVWGDTPLGTAPVVSNVLYVSMDGSDTNDGRAADASRACRTISGAVNSPYYQSGTSIKVAPGRYYENNPILLKPYTSVIGSDLRTTSIEPINKTQDLFHLQSGCYLAQMQFVNGQSGLLPGPGYAPGTNRGAYCTAFPPNYGGTPIDVYHSPYIQNCTNQSGPWLIDGTMFIPNQTVQIPQAVGTATWTINTTTMLVTVSTGTLSVGQSINVGRTPPDYLNARTLLLANIPFIQEQVNAYITQTFSTYTNVTAKSSRDVGLIVQNIAYDVAFGGNQKTVEAGSAYWNGVTSVIPGSITQCAAAINYINTLSQAIITNATATNLLGSFQTQPQVKNTNLTGGGTAGSLITKLINTITNIVVNGLSVAPQVQVGNGPDWGSVSAEILLQNNRSFIQDEVVNWVNATYPGFTYNQELCWRDTGLIIDAITQDIVLNSNAKTIEAANTYWTGAVNILENAKFGQTNQVPETVAAINRAETVALQVIANSTVTTTGFTFDSVKCGRDTGLIVDALAQDLLFQSNSQATFAGIQYWNHGNYVGNIAAEITTTTEALMYLSSLAQQIVTNSTGTRYQNTISQVTNLSSATSAEAAIVAAEFSTITNILINGVSGVTNKIVPNRLTPSTSTHVQNAYNLLLANESYMQAEVIGWIEANKVFQYNQTTCNRDVGLIVDSLSLDLAFPTSNYSQSTFAGLQYWSQNGYVGAIGSEITTTSNAINYLNSLAQKIVVNNTSGTRYSTGTQVINLAASGTPTEAGTIAADFSVILNILSTGTSGVTNNIIPNGITASSNVSVQNAFALLQSNITYMAQEVNAYIAATYPSFAYNADTCYRDVGYIINSVSFDLLYGGNRQAIQSGVYYYSYNSASTVVPNEVPQVTAAYEFIKALSQQIILNETVTPLQSSVAQITNLAASDANTYSILSSEVDRIVNIINNGPSIVAVKEPISVTQTTNTNMLNAAANLLANKAFIQAETIAYINQFLTYQYNAATCARDVGYIINSVSFDLLYGGNRQAIQSGVYYWGYSSTSTTLVNEQVAATSAYQYLNTLVSDIIVGTTIPITYQNTVSQVTNLPAGTAIEAAFVSADISLITDIINNGPAAAPPKTPINLTPSNNTFVQNAATLLEANRSFIQSEVNAFVNATQVADTQVFLPFYDKGASATLSVSRNFGILTNIIQNGPSVAPTVFQGNGIFVKTGLSSDDTKIAPVITGITTVSSNVYQVNISESTVGNGDSSTLYFGQTSVYPTLAANIPATWAERAINPIGAMGGSLVDGSVVSSRSPIASFVYDAFTQVNQGGIGIHITNSGYAQLVSVFTIFCNQAVIVDSGGICSITNSNSNFGDYCLTAKGYGSREFTGYVSNPPVLPYFPTGYYPQNGTVEVFIADPALRPHIGQVMEVIPPTSYVNNQGLPGYLGGSTNAATLTTGTITITGIDTTNMSIGQAFYVIDQTGKNYDSSGKPYVTTGTIISDINYQSITLNLPLNSGGGNANNSNYFNIYTSGNAYYTVLSSTVAASTLTSGTLLLPSTSRSVCSSSTVFINSLTQKIIANQAVTPLQTGTVQVIDPTLQGGAGAGSFITNDLNIIQSILLNGLNSAPAITKSGTLPSGAASAAGLLAENRAFIQAETAKYVSNISTASYNTTSSFRDIGLIVDAVVNDLANGGNYNAVIAGKSFYAQTGTIHLVELEENVTDPGLFSDRAVINFYQRSYMSASGYTFEYVGAGSNYGALPQAGVADPIQTQEVIQLNNGKVFFTSTDQNGDFRIGPDLVISQATGVLSGRTFTKSLFANMTPFILAIE